MFSCSLQRPDVGAATVEVIFGVVVVVSISSGGLSVEIGRRIRMIQPPRIIDVSTNTQSDLKEIHCATKAQTANQIGEG